MVLDQNNRYPNLPKFCSISILLAILLLYISISMSRVSACTWRGRLHSVCYAIFVQLYYAVSYFSNSVIVVEEEDEEVLCLFSFRHPLFVVESVGSFVSHFLYIR